MHRCPRLTHADTRRVAFVARRSLDSSALGGAGSIRRRTRLCRVAAEAAFRGRLGICVPRRVKRTARRIALIVSVMGASLGGALFPFQHVSAGEHREQMPHGYPTDIPRTSHRHPTDPSWRTGNVRRDSRPQQRDAQHLGGVNKTQGQALLLGTLAGRRAWQSAPQVVAAGSTTQPASGSSLWTSACSFMSVLVV